MDQIILESRSGPRFVKFARAIGADGFKVERAQDLATALERAKGGDKPFVIDVEVDANELIIPPKIELDAALSFAKAKVREWFASE